MEVMFHLHANKINNDDALNKCNMTGVDLNYWFKWK